MPRRAAPDRPPRRLPCSHRASRPRAGVLARRGDRCGGRGAVQPGPRSVWVRLPSARSHRDRVWSPAGPDCCLPWRRSRGACPQGSATRGLPSSALAARGKPHAPRRCIKDKNVAKLTIRACRAAPLPFVARAAVGEWVPMRPSPWPRCESPSKYDKYIYSLKSTICIMVRVTSDRVSLAGDVPPRHVDSAVSRAS